MNEVSVNVRRKESGDGMANDFAVSNDADGEGGVEGNEAGGRGAGRGGEDANKSSDSSLASG